MSLLLVPATRENLEKSIENSVDLSLVRQFLPDSFVEFIVLYSGIEGVRCWAMTKNRLSLYNDIEQGDEVLLTEKTTGHFTHYGIVIAKIQNVAFGNALWPVVHDNPWENIYFLANIVKVNINKSELVASLGYALNFTVPGAIRLPESKYLELGSISKSFAIPVYDNVKEVNEDRDFSSENVQYISSTRRGQIIFSKEVKKNYKYSCAICGVNEPEFLIAGHISTWAEDIQNRMNPKNGICLCALHDKAFEHGYIGLNDYLEIIISPRICQTSKLYTLLKIYDGKKISLPATDWPDPTLLGKHRKKHNL